MNDCCSTSSESSKTDRKSLPKKFTCPVNAKTYIEVSKKTILQHIKSPWQSSLDADKYYFGDDPGCDVVYFGINGSIIDKSKLRIPVDVKEESDDALICYCFGVSKSEALQNPEIKNYVTQQTKEKIVPVILETLPGAVV